jgi:16S rRNA (uracil1498-N3)-methyltransferase
MVSATDGKGNVYRLSVESASGREVLARVVAAEHVEQEDPRIYLFQAALKPSRMELVVEKGTELGLWGFTPVLSAGSDAKMGRVRMERLRRTAVEAMKQSLRAYLPDVRDPVDFADAVKAMGDFGTILVASEWEDTSPLDQAPAGRSSPVALWAGPAGGFTEAEIEMLKDCGGVTFTLGPKRLRSETAAIASLAILHHLLSTAGA